MKEDLGYVQEKLFEAVICLASGEAGLSGRLDYASDFILRIQERHFPPSNDGDRQLEKFRSIRGRLANGVPAQALQKLDNLQQRQLASDIVGLAFDVMGFIDPAVAPRPSGPPSLKIVR
jgi:hypothetical protein